jgi:ferredoxin-thioredoxin reductase catalytic chain
VKMRLRFFAGGFSVTLGTVQLREKARMPRSPERAPTLKGGDEWPYGFGGDQPPNIDGFFDTRRPVLPHGALHGGETMREEVEKLYETLRKLQEPKGYYLNADKERTFDLLEGLITNKKRYGYMCCPCRLASGDRQTDKDIICPCIYRVPDVEEYGSCYCNLYVSKEWNEGKIARVYVPERRPADKFQI